MPRAPLPDELVGSSGDPTPPSSRPSAPTAAPYSAATWYDWDDGGIVVNMDFERLRLSHMRRDPRVAVTVLDLGDWYRAVTVLGRVVELHDDEDLVDIDRLSMRYRGSPTGTVSGSASRRSSSPSAGTNIPEIGRLASALGCRRDRSLLEVTPQARPSPGRARLRSSRSLASVVVASRAVSVSKRERLVCDAIAQRRDELVELARRSSGSTRRRGTPTTRRAKRRRCRPTSPSGCTLPARRSRSVGANGGRGRERPLVPAGLDFAGRPQLVARFAGGGGGGQTLLLNGHIDAVSAEPRERWTSDPFAAEVRDGMLYGRGSCDMKGGIAAMVLAARSRTSSASSLRGDLMVATNTDEESSGAGGSAIVAHGLAADAGIVTEPTGFDIWVACRGSEYGVVARAGEAGPRGDAPAALARRRGRQRDREGDRRHRRDPLAPRRVGDTRRARPSVSARGRTSSRRWRKAASGP